MAPDKVFAETPDGRFELMQRCEYNGRIFGPYYQAVSDRQRCTELVSEMGSQKHGYKYCDFHHALTRINRYSSFYDHWYKGSTPDILISTGDDVFKEGRRIWCTWRSTVEKIGKRPSWEYGIEVEMAFNRHDDYLRAKLVELEQEFAEVTGLPIEEVRKDFYNY